MMNIGLFKMSERNKSIRLSKETHKELSIKKIEMEYNSFEEMIVEEFLKGEE